MTNGAQSIMPSQPIHSALDGSGLLSQSLPANDDPGTLPADTRWQVAINITGASEETYAIVVPHAAAGGTADLGSLLPGDQPVG